MLLRTIADNYGGDLEFIQEPPDDLLSYLIPGARYYYSTGAYGSLLFQRIEQPPFVLWHRTYLLNRFTSFTCMYSAPVLKLHFQLRNTVQKISASLGTIDFHERGFNMLHLPFILDKFVFRSAGVFEYLEVYFPKEVLEYINSLSCAVQPFRENIHNHHPARLMPVNQVATDHILRTIDDVIYNRELPRPLSGDRPVNCFTLLEQSLEEIARQPRTRKIRLTAKELEQLYYVREMLEQNMHVPFYLDRLPEITSLSLYKLKQGFKQLFNLSPAAYFHNMRLEKARVMMLEQVALDETAEKTGYGNLNSFANAYRKYHKVSPAKTKKVL